MTFCDYLCFVMKLMNGDKIGKKVTVRQKRVTVSEYTRGVWAANGISIVSREGISIRRLYRKIAQEMDVDILTVKNAFILNLATPNNIDRITKILEKWKSKGKI